MDFYALTSTTHVYFKPCWKLYESAFPSNEKRTLIEQEKILQKKEYTFLALYEKDIFLGILSFWTIQAHIFIEHFAIDPHLRGQNYGSKILNTFIASHKHIILEIEPLRGVTTQRRLDFYKNLGFVQNKVAHFQVPFRKGDAPFSLEMLSYKTPLLEEEYALLYAAMKELLPV